MAEYKFTVIIEPDEDGFHGFVPALPGCHTFGATVDETRANLEEAIELHIESMLEDGETVPPESELLCGNQSRRFPKTTLAVDGERESLSLDS